MKTPIEIKYALPCAEGRSDPDKCVVCAYREANDCIRAVIRDTRAYIGTLERMAQAPLAMRQSEGTRRKQMYLYTFIDRKGNIIVEDEPAERCAALMGYGSRETIRTMYAQCMRGEDIGVTITRRKGLVLGETTPQQKMPYIVYDIYNAEGVRIADSQTATDLAERYGNTPKGMRSTLRYLGINYTGAVEYKGEHIVQRYKKRPRKQRGEEYDLQGVRNQAGNAQAQNV